MTLRIATFNAENLLNRFDFSGFRNELRRDRAVRLFDIKKEAEYRQIEIARHVALTDDKRQMTAQAIAEADADILCLQEVEDLDTLHAFEYGYLFKMMGSGYLQKYMVEGNDSRGIDVAIMMREETRDGQKIHFVICGDFNDYYEKVVITGDIRNGYQFTPEQESGSSLDVLLGDGFTTNPVERRDQMDHWTLYHTRGPEERHLCQLDYILLSPALAEVAAHKIPEIVRSGQPWRTLFPPGQEVDRYPRTGWDRPKASDHCPVVVEVPIL